jgi:hypothetical protein
LTATAEQYVEYALTWVGITPYVYGGMSLTTGTDCSGYCELTAGHFGYSIPRTTQEMWATMAPGNGSVGDLALFNVPSDGPPQPQHVGICIGGGMMVNAPHTGVKVRVEPIPHLPGEITVMGYRRIPFAVPAPIPVPNAPTKEEQMTGFVNAAGQPACFAADPQGHLLYWTLTPGGWSVVDATDAIAAAPDSGGKMYTVQP